MKLFGTLLLRVLCFCVIGCGVTSVYGGGRNNLSETDIQEPHQDARPETIRVLVTGASGFIGSSIVKELLERGGYQVRGTVRDLNDDLKTRALRSFPHASSNLELVQLELSSDPGVFKEVAKDVDWIMHTAALVNVMPKFEDEAYQIELAINSTLHLLKAAQDTPSVKRFILTSSDATVAAGYNDDHLRSTILTEEDWAVLDDPNVFVNSYCKLKTLSERAAWQYMQEQDDAGQPPRTFTLSTIHPTMVFGPVPSGDILSSTRVLQRIMEGIDPALPNLYMGFVDIRDVVEAHIRAAVLPEAAGKRFILVQSDGGDLFIREIANVLKEHFGPLGYRGLGLWKLPKWIAWFISLFDKELASVYSMIDRRLQYDNSRSREVLGLTYTPANQTLIDAVNSMVEHGLVAKPDGSYHRPQQEENAGEL